MKWFRLLLLAGVGWAAVGCGSPPALPTADAAAEKEDEEAIKKAGAAERKARPAGKKPGQWEPHPNDQ